MKSKIIEWLNANWKKGLVSISGVVFPLLAFWLSPIKDKVFEYIWPEKASLQISVFPEHPSEGDSIDVRITAVPKFDGSISSSLLTIGYDRSYLQLRDKADFAELPSSTGPLLRDFSFVAISHGATVVTAHLHSQQRDYVGSIDLLTREKTVSDKPSFENISGTWSFHVQYREGELHLVQRDRLLSGSYEMEPQEAGQVTGYHDGCVVFVQLKPSKGRFKTILDGNVGQNAQVLEIKGNASRASLENPDLEKQYIGAFEGAASAAYPATIPDCVTRKD